MPILPVQTDPRSGARSLDQLVVHSAARGRLQGCAFQIEGKWLDWTQPTLLCGALTAFNGTEYVPAPGQRPLAHQYSLRHPGILDGSRVPFEGMVVWALTHGLLDQSIFGLFNHMPWVPGEARAHDYPDELALVGGASISALEHAFRNHAPLIGRNTDYTWDLTTLLNGSARMSWTEWQAGPETPKLLVLASDGNFAMAVDGSEDPPGAAVRQMGLNPPVIDILSVEPIDVDTDVPVGPQMRIRWVESTGTGTAVDGGGGPTDFTDDPDQAWDLDDGSEIEVEMGYPIDILSKDVERDARLFVGIVSTDGTITTASLNFLGTYGDQETREPAYTTANGEDAVSFSAASTRSKADGTSTTASLYVSWSPSLASSRFYRRDPENPNNWEYPRIRIVNAAGGSITKILVFRAGRKISRDDEPTSWHHAYQWELRRGTHVVRGGHSGDYEQLNVECPANSNLRFKSFSPALQSEEPTHMNIALRAFDIGKIGEASTGNGIAAAFTIVRTVPVRRDAADSGIWKTDTGYTDHDLPISDIVVDCWMDAEEIAGAGFGAAIPGGLLAPGGCSGVAAFDNTLLFFGFEKRALKACQFVAGSKFVESSEDKFYGWFAGRKLVRNGKSYEVRRVIRENLFLESSFTAKLELVKAYDGATETGQAFLDEDRNTFWQTVGDGRHGENISLWNRYKMPQGDDIITAIRQEGRGVAKIFCQKRVYTFVQSQRNLNIYQENAQPSAYSLDLDISDNAAAGLQCLELAEGRLCADNGRGLSLGWNASTLEDFTSPKNARLFTELFAAARAEARNLRFDHEKRLLLLSNIRVLLPTYPGVVEWGAVWDFQNQLELALLFPWHGLASGKARLASGFRSKADARADMNTPRARFVPGPICVWVDVAHVGSGGAASQTGPHLAIYDTRAGDVSADTGGCPAGVWTAIPLNGTQLEPQAGQTGKPLPGTRSTAQLADGSIIAACDEGNSGGTYEQSQIRLVRAADGSWSQSEENEASFVGDNSAEVFAWLAGKDKTFYALRVDPAGGDGLVSVVHYEADTIESPYEPGIGGRHRPLEPGTDDAFTFNGWDSASNAKTIQALIRGGSGELLVFGYVQSTGALTVRALHPRSLLPLREDFSVTLSDAGDPSEASPGNAEPGRGPRNFICNRHGEVFFTERKNTSGTGGYAKLSLNRLRLPDRGFAGSNTVLLGNLDTPRGQGSLLLDQRQQLWFAHDVDVGSGRRGVKVYVFAEEDTELSWSPVTYSRTAYHRDLHGMVAAGNFVWLLFRDTPVVGGSSIWRLVKCIGSSSRERTIGEATLDVYLGDGRADINGTGGSSQTEDAEDGSVFFDIKDAVAGSGGSISYASIDTQMERATGMACQANATNLLGELGLAEI